MTLSSLSPLAFLAGLAGLAGGLYLLHRLRVRHERVPVVTTLFWKQAVEDSRARERTQRFRHPLAYALSLGLLWLLWSVVGGLRGSGRAGRDVVLLLDHSARAALGGRLEMDAARLLEEVARHPREVTTVLAVGAGVRTLLLPDENPVVLEERLAALEPEAAPSRLDATLAALQAARPGAEGADGPRPLDLVVLGDAPVSARVRDDLAPGVTLARSAGEPAAAPAGPALVACGVAPAASGAWSRVDLYVRVAGDAVPRVTLDDQARELVRDPDDPRAFRAADLPARGGRLVVELPEAASADTGDLDGDLAADPDGAATGAAVRDALRRAAWTLPDRPPLRVALGAGVAETFSPLIDADPGLVRDDADPDVVLRAAGEAVGGDVPAFELVAAADAPEALWLGMPETPDPLGALSRAVGELGLDRVDADELASDLGRPIVAATGEAPVRTLRLWRELLEPGRTSFPAGRAFPVLVARGLRWLADVEDFPRERRAGQPLFLGSAPFTALTGSIDGPGAAPRALDPLGEAFVPARAGTWTDAAGRELRVQLTDPAPFLAPAARGDAELPAAEAAGAGGAGLATWVLLLVLALSVVEWRLFRTGRMP